MRFLIVCGSKMGGTAGLGEMAAHALESRGHEAVVSDAADTSEVGSFDGVIVGGALYSMRWHEDARRFVRRNAAALRMLPVYFFSSGPLDDSALEGSIPPTRQVQKLMEKVGARGHVTFGGRMPADAKSLTEPTAFATTLLVASAICVLASAPSPSAPLPRARVPRPPERRVCCSAPSRLSRAEARA